MRADQDDTKRDIAINAIYELTEQGKNNISSADIRKDIELKFELKDIDLYLILNRLLKEGCINEIEPLKNLIGAYPKNAVVSFVKK
jgi:patatin-like phospholipase/acyl hydrolase